MEICSEAPGYLEHWPSDITISINGHEVGTYCSPGDYGARRGNLTPLCWPNGRTQYGILKTFSVREHGGYIDGALVNQQLGLKPVSYTHLDVYKRQVKKFLSRKRIPAANTRSRNARMVLFE